MRANLFTIPAGVSFAETLVRGLLSRFDLADEPLALANVTIYLPTRRAARTLTDAFARIGGGSALIPKILPLGDTDDDDLLFQSDSEEFSLVPPIGRMRRNFLLATLIARWSERSDTTSLTFAQAVGLANSLSSFLDEMQTQGIALSKTIDLVPAAFAEHWGEVDTFLSILSEQWPTLLATDHRQDPSSYRDQVLRALAQRLRSAPPQGPVIAAGSTGSIPATAELLDAISRLDEGAVVLPGLDLLLDEESWQNIDPSHPQYGMQQLLSRIGATRDDVQPWDSEEPSPRAREALLRESLRPAPTTDAWRQLADDGTDLAEGLRGLKLVDAADPAEEAVVIALMLREALEIPGQTAALVTPDRSLARRVAAELSRWQIAIDDSAGVPLAHTPPGAFLCLLAQAASEDFAPVSLLALLKHPLAAAGEEAPHLRWQVRELDLALRGPAPDPGLQGIAKRIGKSSGLTGWFKELENILRPLTVLLANNASLEEIVAAHALAAEKLAATTNESGESRLWRGEAGEAAATLVAEFTEASAALPPVDAKSYAALFRKLAERKSVRPRYGQHSRLAILGTQEARLQNFDLVVLGGLNESIWPSPAAVDPWLSRPLRKALGLDQPERMIGLAAHDFATLAAGPRVVLTRARKSEGAPTVASRWVQRLIQLTRGLGLEDGLRAAEDYSSLAARLADAGPVESAKQPRPMPPVKARPRALSVTQIETWIRDPYAIYARHILNLKPLNALDEEVGALERGTAIHRALEKFLLAFPDMLPVDAELSLVGAAEEIFAKQNLPASVLALWRPRLLRAARWFVSVERARRIEIRRSHHELKGERIFPAPGGDFRLHARADRIDELKGGGAALVDYKTGTCPSDKQVKELLSPQLPLEGAILAAGGFAGVAARDVTDLIYIRFAGGEPPGEMRILKLDPHDTIERATANVARRIAEFDDPSTPYRSRVMPYRAAISGDYDHLARVREWSLSGWSESGE